MSETNTSAPAEVVAVSAPTSAVAGIPAESSEVATEATAAPVEATEVAPKTEETPKSVEETRAAAKFAALSRRDKALKAQERELQKRAQELEARAKALEEAAKDPSKYISREDFKKNPYKYMQEDGIKLESLAEMVLNDGKMTPEKIAAELEAKVQAKLEEIERREKEKEQKAQEQYIEQTIQAFKQDLTKFVNDTPDYELIRANNAIELVYEVIEQHCEATIDPETGKGVILSNKEASDMVEQYLLNQEKARIEQYRKLNKTKGLFEPSTPKVEQNSVKAPNSPTLTNTLASTVPSKESKKLTKEESLAEAAKLLKWNS